MQWLRAFGVGLGAGVLVAAAAGAGYVAFDHVSHRSGAAVRVPSAAAVATPSVSQPVSPAAPSSQPETAASGGDRQTTETLLSWQASGALPEHLKAPIMDAAIAYFARRTGADETKLRQQVVMLSAAEYNSKSVSNCDDAANVRPPTEAWLLDIRGDTLFVNDGFTSTTKQSAVDLFFRYMIGLYSVAPELKSYPNGVRSSDGTTAYYEKGLILLGRRTLDQLVNTSCYLQYRRPLEDAFTADRALSLVARLGLVPAPDYVYPQKRSLETYRAKIAPRLGSAADELVEPFLKTDSGEFYRRAGRALGSTREPAASEAAAAELFPGGLPAVLSYPLTWSPGPPLAA